MRLGGLFLLLFLIEVFSSSCTAINFNHSVQVYYILTEEWDNFTKGGEVPNCSIKCHWKLVPHVSNAEKSITNNSRNHLINVLIYHYMLWRKPYPLCSQHITYHVLSFLEPMTFYPEFLSLARSYDGVSSTSPNSTIQTVYPQAYLPETRMFPVQPFQRLVKGISVFISNCHSKSARNEIIRHLSRRLRVDNFGRCNRNDLSKLSPPPGLNSSSWQSIVSQRDIDIEIDKCRVINHYMFYFAAENTLEEGYVSEKLFTALLGGSIPIYLGDSLQAKRLLDYIVPGTSSNIKDSVIYLDDYLLTEEAEEAEEASPRYNYSRLVADLTSIMNNATKFESFWKWRQGFSSFTYRQHSPLLKDWRCRVCEWAVHQQSMKSNRQEEPRVMKKPCYLYPHMTLET